MDFNFLNEDFRKKHLTITKWNLAKKADLKKLFFDELDELNEALEDYGEYIGSFGTNSEKEFQELYGNILSEIADCLITFYHLDKKEANSIEFAKSEVFEHYRKYNCNELKVYMELKIERTLRYIKAGVYDERQN